MLEQVAMAAAVVELRGREIYWPWRRVGEVWNRHRFLGDTVPQSRGEERGTVLAARQSRCFLPADGISALSGCDLVVGSAGKANRQIPRHCECRRITFENHSRRNSIADFKLSMHFTCEWEKIPWQSPSNKPLNSNDIYEKRMACCKPGPTMTLHWSKYGRCHFYDCTIFVKGILHTVWML